MPYCRDMREKYLVTYEEMHTDTPPFVDLFAGEVCAEDHVRSQPCLDSNLLVYCRAQSMTAHESARRLSV